MKRNLLAATALLAGTLLTGCGGGYGYGVSYGPPPPRYGAIGYAPGPGYVWTDGYWNYSGRNWAWVDGRWARPPRGHSHWERSEWRREGNRWRFHRGGWR